MVVGARIWFSSLASWFWRGLDGRQMGLKGGLEGDAVVCWVFGVAQPP